MFIVLALILGVAIGLIVGKIIFSTKKKDPVGVLKMVQDEEELMPYLFLELNRPVEDFANDKQILLDNYISQK